MARERISGPLGIWPFPVLNAIIEFLERLRAEGGLMRAGTSSGLRTAKNVERWEAYRDERGRLIIEVHREAE